MGIDLTVAVVGAGPYGLATTSLLRSAGIETQVFGDPMSFWSRHMPAGMKLRSPRSASNIGQNEGVLTLDTFERSRNRAPGADSPIPLEDFVAYGRWFQSRVAPDVEPVPVIRVARDGAGFRIETSEGDAGVVDRVVVAAGIHAFAWRPPAFRDLPAQVASHASEHHDLSPFAGRRVAVIGAGQSALETAALLDAAGADARVIVRRPHVHWRRRWFVRPPLNIIGRMMYSSSQVGPAGICLITDQPDRVRRLPLPVQRAIDRRSMRPEADLPLRPLLAGRIMAGRTIERTEAANGVARLRFNDGSTREFDHVMLATGYRIDLSKYAFLDPDMLSGVHVRDGYPVLDEAFQTSLPGLHIVGAPAAASFGPLMRFIAGSGYAASAVARAVVQQATGPRGGIFAEPLTTTPS
jgi:FAD-dependent urate hydroxylase